MILPLILAPKCSYYDQVKVNLVWMIHEPALHPRAFQRFCGVFHDDFRLIFAPEG